MMGQPRSVERESGAAQTATGSQLRRPMAKESWFLAGVVYCANDARRDLPLLCAVSGLLRAGLRGVGFFGCGLFVRVLPPQPAPGLSGQLFCPMASLTGQRRCLLPDNVRLASSLAGDDLTLLSDVLSAGSRFGRQPLDPMPGLLGHDLRLFAEMLGSLEQLRPGVLSGARRHQDADQNSNHSPE